MKMHICTECSKSFSRVYSLKRHIENQHNKPKNKIKCPNCESKFTSESFLKRHLNKYHSVRNEQQHTNILVDNQQPSTSTGGLKRKNQVPDASNTKVKKSRNNSSKEKNETKHCEMCDIDIKKRFYNAHLKSNKHKIAASVLYRSNNIHVIKTAFKSRVSSFKIVNLNKEELILDHFFQASKDAIAILIEEHIKAHTSIKVNVELFSMYELVKDDEIETDIKSFNTKSVIMTLSVDVNETLNNWFDKLKTKSEEFNEQNSGWSMLEILHIEVNINKYIPLRASGFIKIPKSIAKKNAVVNVLNSDGNCFAYAIMSALFPTGSNINNVFDYPSYTEHLNFTNINLPMEFSNISKFETQNNLSINVFGLNQSNTKIIGPLHHTRERKERHINLLYYEYRCNTHFVWISDLSRLVGNQLSRHKEKKHICDGCLLFFSKKTQLADHQKDQCYKVKIILPQKSKANKVHCKPTCFKCFFFFRFQNEIP